MSFTLLGPPYPRVMPGLGPGIPIQSALHCPHKRDGRDKPGHDAVGDMPLSP